MGCCEEGTIEVGVTIDEEDALALGQFGVSSVEVRARFSPCGAFVAIIHELLPPTLSLKPPTLL
jgi:hypothetical protein